MLLQPSQIREFLFRHQRIEVTDPKLIRAGVLILLFQKKGELHVLLTKRTSDVEHHKGQISFPGGSVDARDPDITSTALRETEEEIGLRRNQVEILGLFDDVWTPSGFRITPVVGFLPVLPELHLNATEVEEILEVPLSLFLNRKNERVEKLQREGKMVDVYFYRHGGNEIWGATAVMLRSFLRALQAHLARSDSMPPLSPSNK